MTSKISGIYQIINTTNAKYYIGSSNSCLRRRYEHFKMLRRNKHPNIHLQRSYNLCGESKFIFLILEDGVPSQQLQSIEQLYLNEARFDKDNSFNLTFLAGRTEWTPELRMRLSDKKKGVSLPSISGSRNPFFGKSHSADSLRKISEANKGKIISEWHKEQIKKANVGRRMSDFTKRRLSESNIGKVLSQESKNKISVANKGKPGPMLGKRHSQGTKQKIRKTRIGEKASEKTIIILRECKLGKKNPFFGKHHSKQAKDNISKSKIGKSASWFNKPVKQIDKNSFQQIRIWNSVTEAAKSFYGKRDMGISAVCNGIQKSAYGFKWEYA